MFRVVLLPNTEPVDTESGIITKEPWGSIATKQALRMLGESAADIPHILHMSLSLLLRDCKFRRLSKLLQSSFSYSSGVQKSKISFTGLKSKYWSLGQNREPGGLCSFWRLQGKSVFFSFPAFSTTFLAFLGSWSLPPSSKSAAQHHFSDFSSLHFHHVTFSSFVHLQISLYFPL